MMNNKDNRGMQIKQISGIVAKSHKSCLVALVLKWKLCHIEYVLMEIGWKNRKSILKFKYNYKSE